MTKKQLGFVAPVSVAIAANATTPDPGVLGVWVWSTTANSVLYWNGTNWIAPSAATATRPNFVNARVASTANIASLSAVTVIDGVTLANNDVVLLKNQTTGTQNGWYVYTLSTTTLTRLATLPTSTVINSGLMTTVSEGTVNYNSLWMLTTTGSSTIDTTSLTFQTLDNAAGAATTTSMGRSFMLMGA